MGVHCQSVTSATQREAFKETILTSTLIFPIMKHLFSEPFLEEITKTLGVRPHEVQGLGIARQLCEVILEQIGPVIHFLSGAHKITVKIDSISLPSFFIERFGGSGVDD